MEDDKKNAATEEVAEIVQQEAELPTDEPTIEPDIASDLSENGTSGAGEEAESTQIEEVVVEAESTEEVSNDSQEEVDDVPVVMTSNDQQEPEAPEDSHISIEEKAAEEKVEVEQEAMPESEVQTEDVSSGDDIVAEENVASGDLVDENKEVSSSEDPATEESETQEKEEKLDSSSTEVVNEEAADENDYEHMELEGASKKDLLDILNKISGEEDIRKIDHLFKELGPHYELLYGEEKKTALEEFLKIEGNQEADFEYKGDDTDQEFHANYEKLRHKRSHYFQQIGKQKDENLVRKNEILAILREIIDGEDHASFNKVKKLQEDWKNIGPVPGAQNHSLWASYHALMDRFYDQRGIYFELKELDRKKNLEAKIEVVERAEALDAKSNLRNAITQLNELHEEFKHIGPVPKDDQEPLWQRFKAASDQVYEQRKEFNEHLKEEFAANLTKKLELAEKAKDLANLETDRIKVWNSKTKELLELQKQWESVGGVPRESAKEVNKSFWGNFKLFYANKSKFFKQLDGQRDENLAKKKELVAKAMEAKDSKDWEATTKLMKNLQNDWREIGPVPEKFRKSLYGEFKGYCDEFFERKRGLNAEQNKEFESNLEVKKEILSKLELMANEGGFEMDQAFNLLDDFSEAGLVPRYAVGKTMDRYDRIGKKLMNADGLTESDANELRIHIDVCKLRNSPHGDRKINRKENTLKRKITGLENDVNNWKTNIDFFGRSANAEQLKKEFQVKIDSAEDELQKLKEELRYLQG